MLVCKSFIIINFHLSVANLTVEEGTMQLRTSYLMILLLMAFVLVMPAFSQTEISGSQSGTLGPGTYIVVGYIQVDPLAVLTIAPGT